MISGVYRIVNTLSGKAYIGSAVKIPTRLALHRSALRRGDHPNCHLQHSWDKYGEVSFAFETLAHVLPEQLLIVEQWWIEYYGGPEFLYNKRPVAGSQLGMKWSEEVKERMRAAKQNMSAETRRRMSEAKKGKPSPLKGRPKSMEHRLRISLSHKTRAPQSESTRAKRSASLIARWAASKLTGIGLASVEARMKSSKSNKATWAAGRRAGQIA